VCASPRAGRPHRRTTKRNTNTTDRRVRGVTITLRPDTAARALIDRAAEQLGKNRSEFMMEAARREATTVLLDQRLFWGQSAFE
jgi:uncharacterized protein (DUF1778 family)